MKSVPVKDFKYGIIDSEEQQSIPRGASTRSLNYLTRGSKIELRRGYELLGTTENAGAGKITGLGVAKKPDGSDIIFRTRKRKIEFLNTGDNDWDEVGTDAMPAAVVADDALGEEISIEGYQNTTGPQVWLNSKNCGPIKIMTANPASYTEMYVLGTNYKGRMRIKSNRSWVWNRFGTPPNRTDLFASQLDSKASSDYTQISGESIGTSGSLTYSGTLAFKAAGARRICFEVTFTDTSETFTDNGDGTLTGSAGGTGTINYTSGAYSITFNVVAAGAVTATYRWADDSTTDGIANFTYSATRTAGQGFILSQAGGGDFENLMSLNGVEYCMHKRKTWSVTISVDDVDITNLIFRDKVGIPNWRAAIETADGIYYVDDTDENDPHLRLLTLDTQSSQVIPRSISKPFKINDVKVGIDLTDYRFDQAAAIEFGDFVLFACRTSDSEDNNRVLVHNKTNKATDVLDYYVSCFAVYDGSLVAGDSITDNVFILFSGVDDLKAESIGNYWESNLENLGWSGLKKCIELTLEGEIGPEQSVKVSISVDRGTYTQVRSPDDVTNNKYAIEGDGDYVDSGQSVNVGAYTLGRGEIGGGSGSLTAYHFRRSFRIAIGKFEYIKFKVEAMALGYFSLSEFTYRDVRVKSQKLPAKYLTTR